MYWLFLITNIFLWNINRLSIHLCKVNNEITIDDINIQFENIKDDTSTKKKNRKKKKKKSNNKMKTFNNANTSNLDNPMMQMVLNNPEMIMSLMPDSREKKQFQSMLKVPMFKEMLKDKNTLKQIMKLNKNV